MAFTTIDPNEGKVGFGRPPLANTVRIASVGKKSRALRITISHDIADALGLAPKTKANISIGDGDDFGTFCISPTAPTDHRGYTIFSNARTAGRAVCLSVSRLKLYGINPEHTFDCVVRVTKRDIFVTIPTSILAPSAAASVNSTDSHLAAA